MVANVNDTALHSENKFFNNNVVKKIRQFINSNFAMALLLLVMCFFWSINIGYVTVGFAVVFYICVLVFCNDNPKAIILPVISMSLMFNDMHTGFTFVTIATVLAVLVTVGFIIRKVFIEKKKVTKGKLFWPYVLVMISNALAGIIGNFEIKAFVITFLFGFLLYFLYWFVLNFIYDFKTYFAYCLIFLSLIVGVQLIIAYARCGDILLFFQEKSIRVGCNQINAPALFVVSGIISSYYLAVKAQTNKQKILYILLAIFLDVVLLFTFARISMLAGALVNVVYLIILLKNVEKKKLFITIGCCLVCLLLVFGIIFYEKLFEVFSFYLTAGLNGRENTWSWCFNLFKQNPIFGNGFITRDIASTAGSELPVAGGGTYVQIMAHNSILHYLTCTGIVGLVLNIPFYIKKYQIACSNFNTYKMFCLINILCIELVSLFDTAGTHNLFNMILLYVMIGLTEKSDVENVKEKGSILSAQLNKTESYNTTNQNTNQKIKKENKTDFAMQNRVEENLENTDQLQNKKNKNSKHKAKQKE